MEEMLDTFDINGNFIGVKSRSFCHSQNPGVYHKPVWIWIVNSKGEILLQKRALTKKNGPGQWGIPVAGHVSAGEKCLQACVRETFEELGIKVKQQDFIFLKEFVKHSGWELVQTYLLKVDLEINDLKLQTEEIEYVKWFNYDDFVSLLYTEAFSNYDLEYKNWIETYLKTHVN